MKREKVYTQILIILTVIFVTGFQSVFSIADNNNQPSPKEVFLKMSLEEKVGQLIWLEVNDHTQNLAGLIKKYNPAGIRIKSTDPIIIRTFSEIAASAKAKSAILIDVDITRVRDVALFPNFNTISPISAQDLLDKYHQATQQQLSVLGIDRSLHYGIDLGLNLKKSTGHVQLVKKTLFESDGIILSGDPAFWYGEIFRMIKTGDIPYPYFESKVEKVLEAKSLMANNHPGQEALENYLIPYLVNNGNTDALIENLYLHSFTQYRNVKRNIPLADLTHKKLLHLTSGLNDDVLADILQLYYPVETCKYYSLEEIEVDNLLDFNSIFLEISGIITPDDLDKLRKLDVETNLYVMYFGQENEVEKLGSLSSVLWHPEKNIHTRNIAPQILLGGMSLTSQSDHPFRLSYTIPERAGMDSKSLTQIDEIVAELLANNAAPGCQVLVARNGQVVYNKSFGSLFYNDSLPVSSKTLYDLASVTKVLATLPAVMYLDQVDLLDIDKKVSDYLLELRGTDKENVVIRDVLTHQAGLYPYLPFWRQSVNEDGLIPALYSQEQQNEEWKLVSTGLYSNESLQDSLWKWTVESKMRKTPPDGGSYDYKYSDLGFYILKELVEHVSGMKLDRFTEKYVYDPMGLSNLTFTPGSKSFDIKDIAPTELDTYFRKGLIHGTVHDQTAAMFGGVAGHAGLFGNANDIAKMMQMLLWDGEYGGIRYFDENTIEKYIEKQNPDNRRGLGWDKPDPEGEGNTSSFATLSSFGHTGFTGTSVWADPDRGLVYVFLSNRVHPDADNNKLGRGNYRIRIQNSIYRSIQEYEKSHSY